jgi:THO complex subunit 2
MSEGEEKINWSDWEGKGKAAFLNNCNRWLGKNGVILDDKNGLSGLPRLVYDLFWHGIYSSLRVEQVTDMCYSLIRNSDEMGGLVLDVLNIYDVETSVDVTGESRKKLAKLTKSVEGALSKELLQERMEIETLGEFKIVTNKSFYTKFIKIKTKLYYKQNKFNLFREESEGYAKLVAELNQSVGSLPAETALENIKSLIGCFNLDPTRVLDAMLDSFESRPEERSFFSALISSYLPDKKLLCEVIGFKYTSCDRSSYTPASLHNLTIALIHDNIITLDEVYPWLSPDDKAIHKEVNYIHFC